jgi:hypothetical protein
MSDMSEQDYKDLDDYYTVNTVMPGTNGTGLLASRHSGFYGLDELSTDYVVTKAIDTMKTPAEVINEIVHQHIAMAS